ncbi:P-loop containing nucleoside triphosphate hydrolase protein [Gorgonomyces haynaldii]|nr:P-loop containing nucleoside triphosphate hydrolase protein [Gorgonomyces haynaldii]
MILSLLANVLLGPVIAKQFGAWFGASDKRTKMLREVFMGMRMIKFFGLEAHFEKVLASYRKVHMDAIKKIYLTLGFSQSLSELAPALMPVIAFAVFSSTGSFQASAIFPALLLFGMISEPLAEMEQFMRIIGSGFASWKRVNEFLEAKEIAPSEVPVKTQEVVAPALRLTNVTWQYEVAPKEEDKKNKKNKKDKKEEEEVEASDPFKLEDLTMDIQKGSLVGVVGAVGSGKTTLLSGLIGQVRKTAGEAIVNGSLAYCSQTPWIVAGSVERNITFDAPVDEERLDRVVKASSLMSDLNKLKDGIKTEIGENGVNLSGGQKARVALARALYRDADIYLMDDPVAALDAQVGRQVFTRAIKQELKDKTVLFVTHQLQFLQEMDQIIVLDEGKVSEFGSFEELKSKNGVFTKLMEGYAHEEHDHQEQDEEKEEKKEDVSKFMDDEERRKGSVEKNQYIMYLKSMGLPSMIALVVICILYLGLRIAAPYWLTLWTAAVVENPSQGTFYLIIYTTMGLLTTFATLGLFVITVVGALGSSIAYERGAIHGLLHSPMSFFDTQPLGRIINRLTNDVMELDITLGGMLLGASINLMELIATVVLVSISNAYILILMAFVIGILYVIFIYYQPSNRELTRLNSIKKSPYVAHISESLTGMSTLIAFGLQEESTKRFRDLIDEAIIPEFLKVSISIWLNLRLGLVSSLVTLGVVLLAAFSHNSGNLALGATVGLAITYSVQLTQKLVFFVVLVGNLEASFNAVERLDHYCNDLELEAPHHLPDDDRLEKWPTHGKVEFQDLQVAYPSRPDHLVIKNLSMTVQPGEKIGVVGRTGSGKSTLMTALFRVVEPHSGTVLIDGKDIRKLGLHTLRSRMQMIPQEPVLFSGTVRSNLDLESKFTDEQLWDALDLVGLKGYVESQNEKLEMPVSSGGENISAGQRQLICLARAILQQPKIMVMDEATAAVDQESNKLIQEAIKTQFKHTTVIAIAHRLNTIAGYDRVLVLQDGEVAEFDRPHLLLQNPDSLFTQLTDASGPSNAQIIRDIARSHYLTLSEQ